MRLGSAARGDSAVNRPEQDESEQQDVDEIRAHPLPEAQDSLAETEQMSPSLLDHTTQSVDSAIPVANAASKLTGPSTRRSLFICVGDVSADRHAARLVGTLKEACPDLDIWGVGGGRMEEAGVRLIYNQESLAVIGIIEVIKHLPRLGKMRATLIDKVVSEKPDLVLLMDYGGFNLGFATLIRKKSNVPIVYFISPQVWGSRPWRINVIAKAVSKMLVIFPFEEALYLRKGVPAKFVGHPLTTKFKQLEERTTRDEFCHRHRLDPSRPIIGVFPGSRKQEVVGHAPIVLQAISWIHRERPELQFVVSTTNEVFAEALYCEIDRLGYNRLVGTALTTIASEFNEDLMTHSELLWTKSGTTTLEATLMEKPMLIFYRANWLTFIIFLIFKTVKNVGWPNLLSGEELVPELIQLDCRADKLVRYTLDWMDVPGLRKEITARMKELRFRLGEGDFTNNAAREILQVLKVPSEPPRQSEQV